MKVTTLAVIVLIFTAWACNKSSDKVTRGCGFYEEHFGGSSTNYYFAGQKAAQRFALNRATLIKEVTVEMDLLTSTSVNFSIIEEQSGATSPLGGTTLVSTTINSSGTMNSGKITFTFPPLSLLGGPDYYIVLEPVGGDIEVTRQASWPFDIHGEVWRYNGSWASDINYDFSFSLRGDC